MKRNSKVDFMSGDPGFGTQPRQTKERCAGAVGRNSGSKTGLSKNTAYLRIRYPLLNYYYYYLTGY